ncbi:MAG: universal stress protein [Blastocatellia bacterium]
MIQIERILCPTDFSPEADLALRYAIAMAKTYEAKLFVTYCAKEFVGAADRERLTSHFQTTVRAHSGIGKCPPADSELMIVIGDPGEEIARLASAYRVNLIVMSSRRRPVAASLLGSTAEAVCRAAPCPVLVVHPKEREFVGATTCEIDLRRILVAHDFSNDSELAMQYALLMAQEYQTELHLLHVLPVTVAAGVTVSSAGLPSSVEGEFQRAVRLLHQSVPSEALLWCKVKQAVRTGQPYREILSYAEENEIDLICLGVHGAGFAMRALFGSNADRVLRQSPCPVLITRPLKPALEFDR